MKSIEKKLIIVKNQEGLNSTIYYDLMSEKNFLLNDKYLATVRRGYIYICSQMGLYIYNRSWLLSCVPYTYS